MLTTAAPRLSVHESMREIVGLQQGKSIIMGILSNQENWKTKVSQKHPEGFLHLKKA